MGRLWLYALALVVVGFAIFTASYKESDRQQTYEMASASSQIVEMCVADEEARERVKSITIKALDEALEEQIKFLFMVWMKDDRGQPERARVGVKQAVKAHQTARKMALDWLPLICAN